MTSIKYTSHVLPSPFIVNSEKGNTIITKYIVYGIHFGGDKINYMRNLVKAVFDTCKRPRGFLEWEFIYRVLKIIFPKFFHAKLENRFL